MIYMTNNLHKVTANTFDNILKKHCKNDINRNLMSAESLL